MAEFNTDIYGQGRNVIDTGNSNRYAFTIGSQNISMQQGYMSGAFVPNSEVERSKCYWDVGEDSILTKLTFTKTTSGVNSIYHSSNREKCPMLLTIDSCRINTTTFDISTAGSGTALYTSTSSQNYHAITNSSSVNPNAQYPQWYLCGTPTGSNPHFNTQPFILDFDYNGILMVVYVRYGSATSTLKAYLDLQARYLDPDDTSVTSPLSPINALWLMPYVGTETNKTQITNSYQVEDIGASSVMSGAQFINCKKYDLPSEVMASLSYVTDIIFANRKSTSYQNLNIIVLITAVNYTTSWNCYYYSPEDKIDSNGIIKHGTGLTANDIYSDEDIKWILKQIAFCGFWFTIDGINSTTVKTGEECASSSTYLPEIKNGVTTGRYWQGVDAAQQPQATWGRDWREKNGYNPGSTPPTEETERSSKRMYDTTLAGFGRIYKCYPPSTMYPNGTLQSLADKLRSYITGNDYDKDLFYGQNPVDCIIQIKEYPFYIDDYIEQLSSENIHLGRWQVTTTDRPELFCPYVRIKASNEPAFYGKMKIEAKFEEDFLNYEPYSKYDLYLPFCGTVNIPAALAVNSLIEILYFLDLLSGTCIVHIYINYKYYKSVQGQIAVDVPFSGYQLGNYTRDMLNAAYAQKQAIADVVGNIGQIVSYAGSSVQSVGINTKVQRAGQDTPMFPKLSRVDEFGSNPFGIHTRSAWSANDVVNIGAAMRGVGGAIQAGASIASNFETIKYQKSILDHSAPAPVKSSLGGGLINWESPFYVEMLVQRPTFLEGYEESTYVKTVGRACYIATMIGNHASQEGEDLTYMEVINANLSGFPATQPEKVELAKLLADGIYL